jgi:drug/metabolite transporter (DMT)-like permease
MSLVVAVPLGVAAAVVYGASIVVQHHTASAHADEGDTNAASLLSLLHNPRWVMAVVSDFAGFLLQAAALSAGAVVVVQPLVVLMLPVALLVGVLAGWHPRPRPGDYLGTVGIITGLALFLALIGRPTGEHVPRPRYLGLAIMVVLLVGVVLMLVVTGRNKIIRGAAYGAVAGGYFGTVAVMIDAASERFSTAGAHGLLGTARGLVPLAGIVLLGIAGIVLTQMSFQVGALGATLPASLATDPLIGVLLGVILLREHIPLSTVHCVIYAGCLGAVIAGAIRLAEPAAGPVEAVVAGSSP